MCRDTNVRLQRGSHTSSINWCFETRFQFAHNVKDSGADNSPDDMFGAEHWLAEENVATQLVPSGNIPVFSAKGLVRSSKGLPYRNRPSHAIQNDSISSLQLTVHRIVFHKIFKVCLCQKQETVGGVFTTERTYGVVTSLYATETKAKY